MAEGRAGGEELKLWNVMEYCGRLRLPKVGLGRLSTATEMEEQAESPWNILPFGSPLRATPALGGPGARHGPQRQLLGVC